MHLNLTRLAIALLLPLFTACGSLPRVTKDGPPPRPIDVSTIPDAVPKVEPLSRYGNPSAYNVNGVHYQVKNSSAGYVERGVASWYGAKFHGQRTSSGEPYDMYAMTAAHRELPIPCYVEVINLRTGKRAVVKVNDRGPFHPNRVIDLSYAAAVKLGIAGEGTGLVEVRAIDPTRDASAPASAAQQRSAALYVQVGAFAERTNAERLKQRIANTTADMPVEIQEGTATQGTVYRVRLGPMPSVDEADRLAARLGALGIIDAHFVVD